MAESNLHKFDPEEHSDGVYEAFCDFVSQFHYEYDAICKEPPKELDNNEKTEWREQNKRKIFLGKYSSRTLQQEFEQVTTETERISMKFSDAVARLKEHFKVASNTTLANFKFHKLEQSSSESFDAFTIRVRHEAKICDFSCGNAGCSVSDTLVRDQIIIGTRNDDIRRNALKEQWGLKDLMSKGRSLETASRGAMMIKKEVVTTDILRTKRPGKYSRKLSVKNSESYDNKKRQMCNSCSSLTCKGGKKCPGVKVDCFACGKRGHFKGAAICKKKPKKKTLRIESDTDSSAESLPSSSTEGSSSESSESDKTHHSKTYRANKTRCVRKE